MNRKIPVKNRKIELRDRKFLSQTGKNLFAILLSILAFAANTAAGAGVAGGRINKTTVSDYNYYEDVAYGAYWW
jgi:hypothetical protein